jgi:hypothetical protein
MVGPTRPIDAGATLGTPVRPRLTLRALGAAFAIAATRTLAVTTAVPALVRSGRSRDSAGHRWRHTVGRDRGSRRIGRGRRRGHLPLSLRTAVARRAVVARLARMIVAPARSPHLDELHGRRFDSGCSLGRLRRCRTVRSLLQLVRLPRDVGGWHRGNAAHALWRIGQRRLACGAHRGGWRDRLCSRFDWRYLCSFRAGLDRCF